MSWRTNLSHVVSQGKCDAKGCNSSDAKTTYSDGHAYCFSCNTYFPAEHRRPMEAPYTAPKDKTDLYPTRMPVRPYNCGPNYLWLSGKNGLTEEEIDQHFFYAPLSDRHVFFTKNGDEEFFEARSVSKLAVPKAQQHGNKPTLFLGKFAATKTLVIVEDIISAIKVGRQYGSMPLFGAYLSPTQMAAIGRLGLDRVIIWLDCNKYIAGMDYAKKLGMLVPSVAIQTFEDPKYFNDDAMAHIVETAIDSVEAA